MDGTGALSHPSGVLPQTPSEALNDQVAKWWAGFPTIPSDAQGTPAYAAPEQFPESRSSLATTRAMERLIRAGYRNPINMQHLLPGGQTGSTTPIGDINLLEKPAQTPKGGVAPGLVGALATASMLALGSQANRSAREPAPNQPGRFPNAYGQYNSAQQPMWDMGLSPSDHLTNETQWGDTSTPEKVAAAKAKEAARRNGLQNAIRGRMQGSY